MTQRHYPYFVSWSGGKDSCLALQRAIQDYGKTTLLDYHATEEGERSRSHGLKRSILQAQADLLGVTILFYNTSWERYEETFINALQKLRAQGIEGGVFGDIKMASNPDWVAHCEWAQKVCAAANMTAHEPL
jgi:diphthamide synthase (EF-2-diphthine--ammonia ligase)